MERTTWNGLVWLAALCGLLGAAGAAAAAWPEPLGRVASGAPELVLTFEDAQVVASELQAVDAGPTDRDETDDDRTTTALEDMVPMGVSPPPPGRFAAGDVLVVINPRNLTFYATRLISPPPQ